MQYFNFYNLIKKYESTFTLITKAKGHHNEKGDWIEEESKKIELQGAIISHRESKIFRSEGTLTTKDKRLFMFEPLEKALIDSTVMFEDNTYTIMDNVDNAKFTGVYAYTLKYVSPFNGGDAE